MFLSRVFAALLLFALCLSVSQASYAKSVRVRMQKAQSQISITGMNLWFRTENQSVRLSSGRSLASLPSVLSSVILKPEFKSGVVLWTLVEKSSGRVLNNLTGKRVRLKGEMLRIGLVPSPQNLEFNIEQASRFDRGAKIKVDVIATMDLDEYLVGVLPHEMSPTWPLEALKAQAVASRTYALNRIKAREKQGKSFHLETDVMDQVYNWRESTVLENAKLKVVKQAVAETRGEVLEDGGRAIAAYFHADCGGQTEEPSQVWGNAEQKLGTAVDVSCPVSPTAKWSWVVSPPELYAKIRSKLKLPNSGEVREVSVEKLTVSGRVARLAMVFADGERKVLSGNDLRSQLGFDKLKSTKFELSRGPQGQFIFEGRGHGHGAGLCQWGSKALASAGANYRKILAHYYPKAQLNVSN